MGAFEKLVNQKLIQGMRNLNRDYGNSKLLLVRALEVNFTEAVKRLTDKEVTGVSHANSKSVLESPHCDDYCSWMRILGKPTQYLFWKKK